MYLLNLVTRTNNGGAVYPETVSVGPYALMDHAKNLSEKHFGVEVTFKRTEWVDGETPVWESKPFVHYGTEMYYRIRRIEAI